MNLTQMLTSALDNPDQKASQSDMSNVLDKVQQLGSKFGIDPATMQTLMSTVGNFTRGALQDTRAREGTPQTETLVDQHAGLEPDHEVVNQLFPAQEQERLTSEASQKTGLHVDQIKGLLPLAVPLILKMLQGGASTRTGSNAMLLGYLDTDKDGDVDIGDAIRLVSTFIGGNR